MEGEGRWEMAEDPRVDFSNFATLKDLRIPAGMWFTHFASGGECRYAEMRGHVWKHAHVRPSILDLLPSSLQSLHVDFPVSTATIFAVGDGYVQALEKMPKKAEQAAKMESAYRWITELAQAKDKQVQHLEAVTVE